jgi:hypothetical protein
MLHAGWKVALGASRSVGGFGDAVRVGAVVVVFGGGVMNGSDDFRE